MGNEQLVVTIRIRDQETGDRRPETGDRRPETGDRNLKT